MSIERGSSPNDDLDALAARVKAIRDRLGKTQAEFADAVGVSRSFLSEMESGRSKPSSQLILGVAEAFPEIDRDWLLTGAGNMALWDDHLQRAALAGTMRFGSDAKLSAADVEALRCAFRLLEEVIGQRPEAIRKNRQMEFVCVLYNFYIGAYQDSMRSDPDLDPRDYASRVCGEWARRLGNLASAD
jgi:transcriptional regulator with XRE-family HTH domain